VVDVPASSLPLLTHLHLEGPPDVISQSLQHAPLCARLESLALVVVVIGYQHMCRGHLRRFEQCSNQRSHKWFRVFNEVSVLLFIGIVVLAVVKPF
jgi:uncharacterized membrane protein